MDLYPGTLTARPQRWLSKYQKIVPLVIISSAIHNVRLMKLSAYDMTVTYNAP
jgi:hypothetical protein